MNRSIASGFSMVVLTILALFSAGCPKICPLVPVALTATPTMTHTPGTPTHTVTPSATPTPGCGNSYTDDFSVDTLANYDIMDGYWSPSTAGAQSVQVASGEFRVAPPSVVYPYFVLKSSFFSHAQGDYTVEGDFKLDTVAQGVFGLIFRSNQALSRGYIFQWNGLNSRWEIEKQTAPASYNYVSTSSSPAYVLGTWVHLKVVVSGSAFTASIDTGSGPQVIFNAVTDPFPNPVPYTTGGTGIRTYNVAGGNVMHVDNFTAYACSSSTPTTTPTHTPSPAVTCGTANYSDNFSVNTIANYDIMDGYWSPSTAGAQSVQVTAGEFQVAPPSVVYPYFVLKNSFFSHSLGDYRVEGDFKLDTVAQGVFGLIFRSNQALSRGYIFQWNGLNGRWEIEKQTGPATYYYPATNTGSPYALGTWIHLKVVVGPGNLFNAYITPNGGSQQQIFSGSMDPGTTTPYTAGGTGIRTYNVAGGNVMHVDNFLATTCP